jgi:hypothetical protein
MIYIALFSLIFNFYFPSDTHLFEITAKGVMKNYEFSTVNIEGFSESKSVEIKNHFEFLEEEYSIHNQKGKISLFKSGKLVYSMGKGQWADIYDENGKIIAKNNKRGNSWNAEQEGGFLKVKSNVKANQFEISIHLPQNDPELGLLLIYHQLEHLRQKKIALETSYFSFF